MSAIQILISRLKGVRGHEGRWQAECPAHEDRLPSLSLSEGKNGAILLHCHAGCTPKSVLEAVGMEFSDLFAEGKPKPKPIPIKQNAKSGFEAWREKAMMERAVKLRMRDQNVIEAEKALELGLIDEDGFWSTVGLMYRGYSLMEWEFEVLRTGTTVECVEIYRETAR